MKGTLPGRIMPGRGGGRSGRPFKRPKITIPRSILKNFQGRSPSSRDTTTDAATSGEESTRTRKIPARALGAHSVLTSNQFNVGTTPLADFAQEIILTNPNHTQTRKKKLPPLVVVGKNTVELRTLLQPVVPSKNFSIRAMSVGTRVDVLDEAEHTAVKGVLTEQNIAFYAYHSPNSKPLKFVLHGLSVQSSDDLKNSLEQLEVAPVDLKPLNIKKKRYDEQAVYLLYYAPGTMTLAKLREIKHIDHVAVRWEHYKPPQGSNLSQCRNCQLHGHSSINCRMPPKCLVCAESHKTDACPKRIPRLTLKQQHQETTVAPDRSFIKCANCGKNHTANYMGCEKRKAFVEAQSKVASKRQQRHSKRVTFSLQDDDSFPSLDRKGPAAPTPLTDTSQPTWVDVLQGIKQEQSSAATIIGTMQTMMKTMNQMLTQMSHLVGVLVKHSTALMPMDQEDG